MKLTEDQLGYLQAALEKAMDNESDDEYYGAFAELHEIVTEEMSNV
jgi:hypothetical protein